MLDANEIKGKEISRAYSLLLSDLPRDEVYRALMSEFGCTQRQSFKFVLLAYERAAAYSTVGDTELAATHFSRYELIYEKARASIKELGEKGGAALLKNGPLHYTEALQALRNKENLVGLHNKHVKIEVNNIKVAPPAPLHDVSRLTLAELKEFRGLLNDCRTRGLEGISATVVRTSPPGDAGALDNGLMGGAPPVPESLALPESVIGRIAADGTAVVAPVPADQVVPKEKVLESIKGEFEKQSAALLEGSRGSGTGQDFLDLLQVNCPHTKD